MNTFFKTSPRGEYVAAPCRKYFAAQRKTGISQITFDLQLNKQNRIFKTTNIMSFLPSISLKFMKSSKFHNLNFNESS